MLKLERYTRAEHRKLVRGVVPLARRAPEDVDWPDMLKFCPDVRGLGNSAEEDLRAKFNQFQRQERKGLKEFRQFLRRGLTENS